MAKENDPVKEALEEVNEVFLDDEGEAPADYSENEAVDSGEQINEQLAKSKAVEPVPEGAADFVDRGKTARAEEIADDPYPGMSRIERAQAEKYKHVGVDLAHGKDRTVQSRFVDFTQEGDVPAESVKLESVNMILVSFYGGQYKAWHFDNLSVIQGFAQNLKGIKRLFKFVPGTSELQEINAMGVPIKR